MWSNTRQRETHLRSARCGFISQVDTQDVHIPSDRKLSTANSKLLMRQSQELERGLFNLLNESKGRFLVCLPAPLKRRKRLQCMTRRRETSKQRLMHYTILKRPVTQNKILFSLLKLCRMSEDVLSNFKR